MFDDLIAMVIGLVASAVGLVVVYALIAQAHTPQPRYALVVLDVKGDAYVVDTGLDVAGCPRVQDRRFYCEAK